MKGSGLAWRALRLSGKTQADFAKDVHLSPRTLSRILKNHRAVTAYELDRIRAYLALNKEK